ncbi:MAG: hypothetical protein LUI14_10855 [Lachnospiraceae bacterium]|nr:hypothetical protein [Lachnospiraceae bacterium]
MSNMSTKESTRERAMRIIESTEGELGYAYLYPADGGNVEICVFRLTPYNIANFLGAHQFDVKKIVLTTFFDTLVLDTVGGFIMTCPDQNLCREIIKFLAPIQMGEEKAKEIDMLSQDELSCNLDELDLYWD